MATKVGRLSAVNNYNNNSNFNANHNNIDNNNAFAFGMTLKMAQTVEDKIKKPMDLWQELCSKKNLFLAFWKARKHKTKKTYVLEFEKNLTENLSALRVELLLHAYRPKPLVSFIIKDPKTRRISKSDFRDRIIHHALCNILEPIFDKTFIYDSYANRKRKGTLKAIERFDYFNRKVSMNFSRNCFVLKADIRHYFDTVSHEKLLNIIRKRISDKRVLWLIRIILENHEVKQIGLGMPLGNLTSQFFANVYLNELDNYIKHKLKEKYYMRYVDDFVILAEDFEQLDSCKLNIRLFLKESLGLELHPEKSKVLPASRGISFLGLRVFSKHKLIKKSNLRKFKRTFNKLEAEYKNNHIKRSKAFDFYEGWSAFARNANTHSLRLKMSDQFEKAFAGLLCDKEISKYIKILSKTAIPAKH